ncbi:MAG: potassium transporter KefB, partial [Candidatus Marinimicrobia bacterium]|nr:potassium transporter KefB [Candidatus Neomarinimicrobiota bacterium]
MGIPLLNDLLIIFILSIGIMLICHRLGIPLIVGLLITGIVTGPSGLGLVTNMHEVEILAKIGIILLLFEIGIEFSLRSLLRIKRIVLIGGGMQVTVTIFATMLFARLFGIPYNQAVFFGFLVSLSSTALVLKLMQERAMVESPPGQLTLGILIFQDIIIVPLLLFVPILAGGEGNIAIELLWMLGKSVIILGITYLGARYLVPMLLNQIARTRSREVFLITIVSICFAVAWMTSYAGLSLSLGAFLAGLIISESEYSQQALGFVVPFKDLFTSIFFISIGMLLNVSAAIQQFWLVLAFALTIILSKTIITTIAGFLAGSSIRTAIIGGLMIAQVGEFSFILADAGHEINLIS